MKVFFVFLVLLVFAACGSGSDTKSSSRDTNAKITATVETKDAEGNETRLSIDFDAQDASSFSDNFNYEVDD